MASELAVLPLEDCLDALIDYRGKTPRKTNHGIPLITAKVVKSGRIETPDEFIAEEDYESWMTRGLPEIGDVVLTTEAPLGEVAQIKLLPVALAQRIVTLRGKPGLLDNCYLLYLLQSREMQAKLVGRSSGTTVIGIKQSELRKIELALPPISEQRAIAHILGTLDDKIALNRKQNETLEAMARALFKAWFVDFEPVRAKMEGRWQRGQSLPGLPAHLYDLFPDRLVGSELGEIPEGEGWRVFSFGDVARQEKGSVNPTDERRERFAHYSIPAFDTGKIPVIEFGESIKSNKTPVPDGAVLVSKLNPHIPRVWLVGQAGNRAVWSTEFIVWTPTSPANSAFLYCLASSSEFVDSMCQLVTGTSNSHQRVKPDQLREIRVCAASDNVIDAFSEIVESLMDQVLQNGQQSKNLAQLRGTLLPKLISGELRIADAKAFLKERGL